jgi:hypothetical protein
MIFATFHSRLPSVIRLLLLHMAEANIPMSSGLHTPFALPSPSASTPSIQLAFCESRNSRISLSLHFLRCLELDYRLTHLGIKAMATSTFSGLRYKI